MLAAQLSFFFLLSLKLQLGWICSPQLVQSRKSPITSSEVYFQSDSSPPIKRQSRITITFVVLMLPAASSACRCPQVAPGGHLYSLLLCKHTPQSSKDKELTQRCVSQRAQGCMCGRSCELHKHICRDHSASTNEVALGNGILGLPVCVNNEVLPAAWIAS